MKKELLDIDLFSVSEDGKTLYGCDQEWYAQHWQRMSGCGPTVATNLVHYRNVAGTGARAEKAELIELMEQVWEHVTPGMGGIPSTQALIERMEKYIEAHELGAVIHELYIPHAHKETESRLAQFLRADGEKLPRAPFAEVLEFIVGALEADMPVAFLALDNGEEPALDEWHWITIVSLEYTERGAPVIATVMDGGGLFTCDLYKWYTTTKRGGGFVYIS
ncbi:MAG: hypothetical protein LBN30_03950 [Oscillospiraceae bacterium]|jgi:hypothetical protein|nr:hypothetical protein [Oscillospiraceae bacterium]